MSWKDEIRKERVSEEHKDRMRALPSYSIPQFDEGANPFDEVYDGIVKLEQMVKGQIETLMQSAQSAFMSEYDVKQRSSILGDVRTEETIEDAFEKIRAVVNETLNKEYDRLEQMSQK